MTGSVLTAARLADLRAAARQETAGPFIDPRLMREVQTAGLASLPSEWAARVLGRADGADLRALAWWEIVLMLRASEADAEYIAALAAARMERYRAEEAARAAQTRAAHKAEVAAWAALRDRLPVLVAVHHNWTARHLDGYEQGGDHIVALAALRVGRLIRAAGQTLCETPSRAHELRHVSDGAGGPEENRLPNCRACLRTANTIAAPEHARQ